MSASTLETALRPREVVQRYVEKEFINEGGRDRRLPTISELSQFLQVSPTTVRAVYSKLSAEGKIVSTPGKGTFLNTASAGDRSGGSVVILINADTNADTGEFTSWAGAICLGAMGEAMRQHCMLSTLPRVGGEELSKPCRDALTLASGVILLPNDVKANPPIARACKKSGIPVVWVNPPSPTITTNFVSSNFYAAGFAVAEAWRKTGRKHLLGVFNLSPSLSVSYTLELAGLYAGWKVYELEDRRIDSMVVPMDDITNFESFLAKCQKVPDAIFVNYSVHAQKIVEILEARGVRVPEECSIICHTDVKEVLAGEKILTGIKQPVQEIGKTTVQMITRLVHRNGEEVPGIYLPLAITSGQTTRESENILLAQLSASLQR